MIKLHTFELIEIIKTLQQILTTKKHKDTVEFMVVNPDILTSTYNGKIINIKNENVIYRGYKSWMDLAHILKCRMLTPKTVDDNFILIRYEKLSEDSFHASNAKKEEKYGINSIFFEIDKNEEASFLYYYTQALKNVNLEQRKTILNLGVNNGDEFEVIKKTAENFSSLDLIGIDYCASAIQEAKQKFHKDKNISFIQYDIKDLHKLNLGKADLIISIGTLQSSNLNFNRLFMSIIQNQLSRKGAIILGFPNCRWIDGEMIYGARAKNYSFSEMGVLYKDVMFCKRYLQQKKFRVTLTGKDYIFLTATSIEK